MTDPFVVLGLHATATVEEIRAARRRLAVVHHPDRGGDAEAMQRINAAFDLAIGHATGRRPIERDEPTEQVGFTERARTGERSDSQAFRPGTSAHDAPSFVVDALPAETFEALLVVTSWLGEVLVDDPPYLLEVHLTEPVPCWCRLEIVPDAGGSTVSLTVADPAGGRPPPTEVVRDLWVDCLNRLGRVDD